MNIFGHLSFAKVYLDDLLIHSENKTVHEIHLPEIKKLLKENSITINLEKSCFRKTKIHFLGKWISAEGIVLDKSILENKAFTESPRSKKHLQSLLGLINWCRPHTQLEHNKAREYN